MVEVRYLWSVLYLVSAVYILLPAWGLFDFGFVGEYDKWVISFIAILLVFWGLSFLKEKKPSYDEYKKKVHH